MSDRSKVDEVMSGVPYVVTLVNGRPPESLNDFVADAVVAITVARRKPGGDDSRVSTARRRHSCHPRERQRRNRQRCEDLASSAKERPLRGG